MIERVKTLKVYKYTHVAHKKVIKLGACGRKKHKLHKTLKRDEGGSHISKGAYVMNFPFFIFGDLYPFRYLTNYLFEYLVAFIFDVLFL